jgi:EAL domain-containing protein (putative c-di-GMP-specific phosphodiesterase class I)
LKIGEWVLQRACKEAMNWPPSVKVAVNLSAVQLRNPAILDFIMCVLIETGLPPERLELEVTETALIEYGADCLLLLRKLKNIGVTIALDDFGTGYSSLS